MPVTCAGFFFFFSSRRRHTRSDRDWSSDVCSSDLTNQISSSPDSAVKHNSVSKTAEMVLEIAPAGEEWKKSVVEQGVVAWIARLPAYTTPPSPEYLKYQQQ